MADYTDIGFDQFLQRSNPPGVQEMPNAQMNPQMTDYQMQSISGNKINGGVMSSANGKFLIDLNQGLMRINNGNQDLVTIGQLSDGNVGLQIKDGNGNTIMEVSNNSIILSSSNGKMQLDFNAETLQVLDDSNTPVVLLGKLS